jgi:hypothetical protein
VDFVAIWNTVLTVLLAIIGFFMAAKFRELDRVSILLNKTREEVARDHITRTEFRSDMKELLNRLDRMETKIDNLRIPKGHQDAG